VAMVTSEEALLQARRAQSIVVLKMNYMCV
jgi:hypothetical protein